MRRLILAGCAAALTVSGSLARAAVYTTADAVMAEMCPGAKLETRLLTLTVPEQQSLSKFAQVRCDSRLLEVRLAWRNDSLVAAGFVDQRTVRTMPGVFLTVVAPDTSVSRIEVLAFHEPPDYRPPARWLGLFRGHRLDPALWPSRSMPSLPRRHCDLRPGRAGPAAFLRTMRVRPACCAEGLDQGGRAAAGARDRGYMPSGGGQGFGENQ